jgi:hypothetical protein
MRFWAGLLLVLGMLGLGVALPLLTDGIARVVTHTGDGRRIAAGVLLGVSAALCLPLAFWMWERDS